MSPAPGMRRLAIYSGILFSISAAAFGCLAQSDSAANVPQSRHTPPGSAGSNRTSAREGQRTILPAEAAAQPARLIMLDGRLTVDANNSDLAQILKDLSDKSGMRVQGMSKSPRIFGLYGPGNIREVLTSLLTGSGYNFMIIGGAHDSVPREVLLAPTDASTPRKTQQEAGGDNPSQQESEQPEPDSANPEERGPGAVYPAPPPATEDEGTRVEQNLQRLQHLQQQQNDPQ